MGTGVLAKRLGQAADNADQRYKLAKSLIGEVSLYSFNVLIATGVYPTPERQDIVLGD
ncbi:hypothetical protein [Amycolatopsis carbonis]|uniref:hypothetical protein n=1 Tax=Amycolatopsis carbonis TaxID=715471 RepID=UPI003341C676